MEPWVEFREEAREEIREEAGEEAMENRIGKSRTGSRISMAALSAQFVTSALLI